MTNKELAEKITSRLIEEMDKGVIPWDRPWTGSGDGAVSHTTGKAYSLINQILIAIAGHENGGEYLTFNQVKAEGGKVKKGAHGVQIVFWKQYVKTEINEDGEEVQHSIPVLKSYTVFSVKDCEGIKEKYAARELKKNNPIEEAEKIVDAYTARETVTINREKLSNRAFYSPMMDSITVPEINQFDAVEEFYSTLFHEMTHSTGHSSRLNRFGASGSVAAFGSEEYSREELIAEIGAACLVNTCGIETAKTFRNSAAYLQGWGAALRADPMLFITAASRAEKAVDYIVNGAKA